MNWFKKAQQQDEIARQFLEIQEKGVGGVQITGTGQNEQLVVPGASKTITARELLERAKAKIQTVLIAKGVKEIDTSPIANPMAQGLAVSHEPGKVHVDVRKIFDQAKKSLPPNSQLDGVTPDPDILNSIVDDVANYIEAELTETISHEGQHREDFSGAFFGGQPFSSVQEAPAEQFGQQIRRQHFPQTFTAQSVKKLEKLAQNKNWKLEDWKEMTLQAINLVRPGDGQLIKYFEKPHRIRLKSEDNKFLVDITFLIKDSIESTVRVMRQDSSLAEGPSWKGPPFKVKGGRVIRPIPEFKEAIFDIAKTVDNLIEELKFE